MLSCVLPCRCVEGIKLLTVCYLRQLHSNSQTAKTPNRNWEPFERTMGPIGWLVGRHPNLYGAISTFVINGLDSIGRIFFLSFFSRPTD